MAVMRSKHNGRSLRTPKPNRHVQEAIRLERRIKDLQAALGKAEKAIRKARNKLFRTAELLPCPDRFKKDTDQIFIAILGESEFQRIISEVSEKESAE